MFRRGTLERQIPNLPQEVEFCTRCVMSNQRPRITFDADGVCGGCRNSEYFKDHVDWNERERELKDLLDQHRRTDGRWDVVVPSSGGKDSTFVAHQLKYTYGMNPLTVTWTPLIYTDVGYHNFQALRDAGFTNLLCSPNGRLHRQLARLSFEEFGDAFHVFVLGQLSYAFHMAIRLGIKLVMYGENGEAEYAGDPAAVDRPFIPSEDFTRLYFKGATVEETVQYGVEHKDYFDKDVNRADLSFYTPPAPEELEAAGIAGKYFMGYFKKWTPQENYYYAAEHTGFRANPDRTEGTYSKYASIDDRLDGMHYFMKFIKFGFGRATDDAAHEIRDGHITRDEGVALVRRYDGEFPRKYYPDFLSYLGITEEFFWEVADSYRLPHIWQKSSGEWTLRKAVYS